MRLRITAAIACGCLIALGAATAGASGVTTRATVFQAFTKSGKPTFTTKRKRGYCFSGSGAADRNDAWRCFVGNYIHDPCFASRKDPGYVACPNANLKNGILIKLTKKLPRRYADPQKPSVNNRPWLIQTVNGKRWIFATGATKTIGGKRANYFTQGSRGALWGLPNRHVEPWTISWGRFSARRLTRKAKILHAWM